MDALLVNDHHVAQCLHDLYLTVIFLLIDACAFD
jgi:hypothetical protein